MSLLQTYFYRYWPSHFSRNGTEAKLIRLSLIKACIQSFFDVLNFSYNINGKLAFINEKYLHDKNSHTENSVYEEAPAQVAA